VLPDSNLVVVMVKPRTQEERSNWKIFHPNIALHWYFSVWCILAPGPCVDGHWSNGSIWCPGIRNGFSLSLNVHNSHIEVELRHSREGGETLNLSKPHSQGYEVLRELSYKVRRDLLSLYSSFEPSSSSPLDLCFCGEVYACYSATEAVKNGAFTGG